MSICFQPLSVSLFPFGDKEKGISGLTFSIHMCYILTMRTKDKSDGQNHPTFTETARRAQIIECTIETIATMGYAQASLAQIARRAGISKGVIAYYFNSREELIEKVVEEVYTAGASFMGPQIVAQSTATSKLQTYIRTNVDYISTHRMQVIALVEIMFNLRTEDGKPRYDLTIEEPILAVLETILRKGQADGEFRSFDPRVMAITIRRAIDAIPPLFAANPHLDGEVYARELVALFDHATRKE
ncbi:MAG TPA: TetR/AcrR family transcriptional regulator [Ktedonobacteraceae bacterium]|nr:TetR/AcrR family transcriptional regulator [Ktedonobacteraceae bacterium]